MMSRNDIYQRILTVAEGLIQSQGYNAFSYRDIANQVGVKTSSIHYHFPTKADLGIAVVKNHISNLCLNLEDIINNEKNTFRQKLTLFFDAVFTATYANGKRMCLGGMLASDALTLPENVLHEVKEFFKRIETWLKKLLSQAVKDNECQLSIDIKSETTTILASLEGVLLLARLYQDETRLTQVKKATIARLTVA